MRRLGLVLVLLAAGPASMPQAWAQMDSREGIALQNQILEVRRDLTALQSQRGLPPPQPLRGGGGGGGGGNEIAAQLLDRVTTLEEEVRRLRGQVDEQANAQRRQGQDLAKQIADLEFRLQNTGSVRTPPPSGTLPATPPAGPPGPLPTPLNPPPSQGGTGRRPPELAMQEGNAALARRDYPAAESAAREVLATGRTGPRAGDAQFLLAQSLTGRRDYQGAAVAFDDAYSRARTGSRAPEALVGLANALANLGDRASACIALDRLRTEFPAPRPDVRETASALRARNACR